MFLETIGNCIKMSLFQVVKFQNRILVHVFSKKPNFSASFSTILEFTILFKLERKFPPKVTSFVQF